MLYKYRDNNVQKLQTIPEVVYVAKRDIRFTLPFRIRLFEKWKESQDIRTIEEELNRIGITQEDVSDYLYRDLNNRFVMGGYPLHQGKREYLEDTGYKESNPLILSGKYHRFKSKWGLEIDAEFRNELKKTYPDISIEEKMVFLGLNPLDVGYSRIKRLKEEFDEEVRRSYGESVRSRKEEKKEQEEIKEVITSHTLNSHPYVKEIERGELRMTEAFYNETYLLEKSLHEIFEIYGIDENLVSENSKVRIYTMLKNWDVRDKTDFSADEEVLKIQRTRQRLMYEQVTEGFRMIGQKYPGMPVKSKRQICRWIDGLKQDPMKMFVKKRILEWVGISRSQYYALLNDENYGASKLKKDNQDEIDIEVIRKVLEYKGFEKGIRQVYMLMPRVAGERFSVYRIRRLMNKYGIRTTIRRPSANRKAMKELITRNRKANLLMRKFKLHRPNEVRLTDVTYLDYGEDRRAYGSASVDPVTGRLVCFIISENGLSIEG